jgi:uncharacterized protein YwqG
MSALVNETGEMLPGFRLGIMWDQPVQSSTYAHKYGGVPNSLATLPRCSGCQDHLHLLLQIDLADPQFEFLLLGDLGYLFVITCLNCASYAEPLYYSLVDKGNRIVLLQQKPRLCVREYPDPLNEYRISYRPLSDGEYPLTQDDLFRLLGEKHKHQLGGLPVWIQREETVRCLACDDEMEYIAMVDSELIIGDGGFRRDGHMFGDEGILYMFVCRSCSIFATKAQSF